jgi:hypothetical protein
MMLTVVSLAFAGALAQTATPFNFNIPGRQLPVGPLRPVGPLWPLHRHNLTDQHRHRLAGRL